MTSWECYGNKGFYMKYIGKMTETESLLSTCCTSQFLLLYISFLGAVMVVVVEFTTTCAISAYHH